MKKLRLKKEEAANIKKEEDENIHKMTKETVRKGTKKLIDQSRWPKHEEICKEAKIAYLA